jgi:cytochrome b561
MALLNTTAAWGWPAKTLHWMVAVLVIGMLMLGFTMVWLVSGLGTKFQLYQLHKSFGVLVWALVVVRLVWRWLNSRVPTLPPELKPWERAAASLTHRGFYVLLLVLPITGWIMASASPLGVPTMVFGLFTLPNLVGSDAALEHGMKLVHGGLALALAALLALHVAAALKHHFVLHDDVLARMLPGILKGAGR